MHQGEINALGDEEYTIKLVHHKQKHSWDCGLACIIMILPQQDRHFFINNFDKICNEEGFGRSTWTIDLCYLLKRFSQEFIYYTTFIGVNPEYKSQFFYEKILHKDKERVTERFKNAAKNGVNIRKTSVKVMDLISHIRKNGPIILLTNAGFLTCDTCKRNNTTAKLITCLPKSVHYHGHYVVLCGYNLKNNQFYYRNPAYSSKICQMDFSAMNKARLCHGTDEDCIFIFR